MSKRRFGYVRELPSGKFQASYAGPDGGRHIAPTTFTHRSLAEEYLKTQQALIQLGQWRQDPPRNDLRETPTFGDYCEHHISVQTTSRGELLEASTQHLYRNLLRTHLSPFAALHLDEITQTTVSKWWAKAIKSGKKTTLSKAYKLMSSVMRRAVDEGLVSKNPCQVKGAQAARTGRRIEVPTHLEISALAKHINPRYRTLILLAANAGLRFGEVTALRRCDLIPSIREGSMAFNVVITRAIGWAEGKPYVKAPKSSAGNRVIPLSSNMTQLLEAHLAGMSSADDEALLFPSRSGGFLRHDVFTNSFKPALERAGLSKDFTPHGLRHFFGTELARAGANLAELKEGLGDSTVSSVMRYVHTTDRAADLIQKMRGAS